MSFQRLVSSSVTNRARERLAVSADRDRAIRLPEHEVVRGDSPQDRMRSRADVDLAGPVAGFEVGRDRKTARRGLLRQNDRPSPSFANPASGAVAPALKPSSAFSPRTSVRRGGAVRRRTQRRERLEGYTHGRQAGRGGGRRIVQQDAPGARADGSRARGQTSKSHSSAHTNRRPIPGRHAGCTELFATRREGRRPLARARGRRKACMGIPRANPARRRVASATSGTSSAGRNRLLTTVKRRVCSAAGESVVLVLRDDEGLFEKAAAHDAGMEAVDVDDGDAQVAVAVDRRLPHPGDGAGAAVHRRREAHRPRR